MVDNSTPGLLSGMFSTPGMDRVFSDANQIQQMLRFEAALSRSLEDCGLIQTGSAAVLEDLLGRQFLTPEREIELQQSARNSGNIAIPFVKMLIEAVAAKDPEAARSVHTGATSQDVLDTALSLQINDAFALVAEDLENLCSSCASAAKHHEATLMAGRTWLQQGPPITLGLKLAGWVNALDRDRERISIARRRAVLLQFGGAVGTLASLGAEGIRVSAAMATHLHLQEPALPWHAHRDNLAEVAAVLGILVGTLGKIARDISLLMQTEVAEVSEPAAPGRGGSSAMPHKRNPVGCAATLAAALQAPGLVATVLAAMPQEHERAMGGWQAEWETLPRLFRLTAGALSQIKEAVAGLQVHPQRMAANLDAAKGLPMAEAVARALAPHIGRERAHALLEEASRAAIEKDESLRAALLDMPEVLLYLKAADIDRALDPANYLGSTPIFIQRALAREGQGS